MRYLVSFLPHTAIFLLFFFNRLPAGEPDRTVEDVSRLLAVGDTSRALSVLDSVLKEDKKRWTAVLARGRLYFEFGRHDSAREDFNRCLFSGSPQVRYRGNIGLGDLEARLPGRKAQAILCYRQAIRNCPDSLEARYKLVVASMAMATGEGVERAADELINLLILDPAYRDDNIIWRDSIRIRKVKDFRRLAGGMEKYLLAHSGPDSLLLDCASYHFQADQPSRALPLLDKLAESQPGFRPERRHLVRARCLAELDDTSGFQAAYDSALASAEVTGDFDELISEAATIFRPEEQASADTLRTAEQWARFFRVFWSRRDPDPLTPVNERLFEHYRRLRYAQRMFPILNPYVRFMRSRTFHRLLDRPSVPGYEYDSDLFFDRNRDMFLEPRGLLLIRHGEPDEIRVPEAGREGIPDVSVFRYGSVFFPFAYVPLTGGQYLFKPLPARGIGNITKAMDNESFKDPLPALETDCNLVSFMTSGGKVELEAYQSALVKESGMSVPPGASLAVFDESWRELARDTSIAVRADIPGEEQWIGVSRVEVAPGKMFYAARMDITGKRAILRKPVTTEAYRGQGLELSGIVLGSPVPASGGTHSRLGVELLPRPSLTFWSGEAMTVYLEVYGLGRAVDGRREYSVSVTVTRKSDDPGVFGRVKKLLSSGGRERGSSLTLSFDRQPTVATEAVPETFRIDTSVLLPGEYGLEIAVTDSNGGESKRTGFVFRLMEPE